MLKLAIFSILLAVLSQVNAGALLVSKCEKGAEKDAPIPVNVIVPKCAYPPCFLRKGESYEVEIDFDVPRDTETLNVVVRGIIGGAELPWTGVKPDGCNDMYVGECPLKKNDYWTYKVEIKVEDIYPVTELIIKWMMRDDSGETMWCFHLPAEIVV